MRPLDYAEPTLVRLPSWLGDFVAAEPLVTALGDAFEGIGAGDRLSLCAPAPLLSLLAQTAPKARRVELEGRRHERPRPWRGNRAALLLTGSFRSAWTAWRAGVPRRIGWSRDLRGWLLTDGVRPPLERGGVPLGLGRAGRPPRYLPRPFSASCYELGVLLQVPMRRTRPRLEVSEAARDAVSQRLENLGLRPGEPYVVANLGARPGSAKAWVHEHWVRVLDTLELHFGHFPAVLVCGPGEEEVLGAVLDASRSRSLFPLLEPTVDLPQLAALASASSVFLTADTGPRHVAEAVGAPVVCVVGPTDPRHTGHDLTRTEVLRAEVPCGPCHRERCPLSGHQHHACMELVDPERVVGAARKVLEGGGRRAPRE